MPEHGEEAGGEEEAAATEEQLDAVQGRRQSAQHVVGRAGHGGEQEAVSYRLPVRTLFAS